MFHCIDDVLTSADSLADLNSAAFSTWQALDSWMDEWEDGWSMTARSRGLASLKQSLTKRRLIGDPRGWNSCRPIMVFWGIGEHSFPTWHNCDGHCIS